LLSGIAGACPLLTSVGRTQMVLIVPSSFLLYLSCLSILQCPFLRCHEHSVSFLPSIKICGLFGPIAALLWSLCFCISGSGRFI